MSEERFKAERQQLKPHKKQKVITIKKPWDDRFWISQSQLMKATSRNSVNYKQERGGKYEKDPRNRNIEKIPDISPNIDKIKHLDKSLEVKSGPPVSITTEDSQRGENPKLSRMGIATISLTISAKSLGKAYLDYRGTRQLRLSQEKSKISKRKRSLVQTAIDAVRAREEGIKNIKEMLEYFSKSPDWEKSNELCEEVLEILNAHRILTSKCRRKYHQNGRNSWYTP